MKVSDVRTMLKTTTAQPVVASDALGAPGSASPAPVHDEAGARVASDALDVSGRA